MIMPVCVHTSNQSLASAEASAMFASARIAHILTPIPASSSQGDGGGGAATTLKNQHSLPACAAS